MQRESKTGGKEIRVIVNLSSKTKRKRSRGEREERKSETDEIGSIRTMEHGTKLFVSKYDYLATVEKLVLRHFEVYGQDFHGKEWQLFGAWLHASIGV